MDQKSNAIVLTHDPVSDRPTTLFYIDMASLNEELLSLYKGKVYTFVCQMDAYIAYESCVPHSSVNRLVEELKYLENAKSIECYPSTDQDIFTYAMYRLPLAAIYDHLVSQGYEHVVLSTIVIY